MLTSSQTFQEEVVSPHILVPILQRVEFRGYPTTIVIEGHYEKREDLHVDKKKVEKEKEWETP